MTSPATFPPAEIKASVLAGAARINHSTIRNLVANGLKLGERGAPGHPVYSLVDVFRLVALEKLREEYCIDKKASIRIVNLLSAEIEKAAAIIEDEVKSSNSYVRQGGPWALVGGDFRQSSTIKIFVTYRVREIETSAASETDSFLVMSLRQSYLGARYRLDRVLGGELPEYAE